MARVSLITLVAVLASVAVSVQGFNITTVLDAYPQYGLFNEWLTKTEVVREINERTGLTVLATTNTSFQSFLSGIIDPEVEPGFSQVIDALRYQVLLTYYGIPELAKINLSNYTEVTTLLQTTGRTVGSDGFVDIYHVNATGPQQFIIGQIVPDVYGNMTIVGGVVSSPYSYSVLELSSFLIPPATTSASPLPSPNIAPAPFSGASPPAPPPPPPGALTPAGSTNSPKRSSSSMVRVSLPATLVVLFLACVAGLV